MDPLGFFKILIILTSALFAIAQYYESRQRKIIEEGKRRLRTLNFTSAENNEGMRDVKRKWEDIQLAIPINNQIIIYPLLILLVIYIVIFTAYVYSDWTVRILNIELVSASIVMLKILLIPLLIASIIMLKNLRKMIMQLSEFERKSENICTLHQAVSKALSKVSSNNQ